VKDEVKRDKFTIKSKKVKVKSKLQVVDVVSHLLFTFYFLLLEL